MAKLSLKGALFALCLVTLTSVVLVILRIATSKGNLPNDKYQVGKLEVRNSPWTLSQSETFRDAAFRLLANKNGKIKKLEWNGQNFKPRISSGTSFNSDDEYSRYPRGKDGGEAADSVVNKLLYLNKWNSISKVDDTIQSKASKRSLEVSNLMKTAAITKQTTSSLKESIPVSPSNLVRQFPKIIIVGFGKAGTKALFEVLKTRPDLIGPEKETRFFSKKFSDDVSSYLQAFPSPKSDQMVIEKSPDYIISAMVPNRIAKFAGALNISLSGLKFIIVLRDPIDRAVSEHLEWRITRKNQHAADLEPFPLMAITKSGEVNENQPFIRTSSYFRHITRWLTFFNNSKTCFVDGDRFAKDPFPEVKLLEECLGLKSYFKASDFIYNKSSGFYCFRATSSRMCMNKSKGRKHPKLTLKVKDKLKGYFRPMMDDLFRTIGRELVWPNFKASNII